MAYKLCRMIASDTGAHTVEWRQFGSQEEQVSRAAQWWGRSDTLAVMTFTERGESDAKYEKPGIDTARVPEQWPGKSPRPPPVPPRPSAAAVNAPPVEVPERPPPTLVDDGTEDDMPGKAPTKRVEAPTGAGAPCGCCGLPRPSTGHYAGDDDPTPTGRNNDMRCSQCGAPWPMPGARRADILRRYLQTRSGGPVTIDSRVTKTSKAAMRGKL
jgi:hypothetical protein